MLPLSGRAKGMVSPSKPANYSRLQSNTAAAVAAVSTAAATNGSRSHPPQSPKLKLVKGPRPLVNYRFYLDIEKHHVSSKIDRRIRELGGSVEFFLVKEVTHFVTDKNLSTNPSVAVGQSATNQHCSPATGIAPSPYAASPQTPLTPLLLTPAAVAATSFDAPSPLLANETREPVPTKPLSRADAMLQRARRSTHQLPTTPRSLHQQQQNRPPNINTSCTESPRRYAAQLASTHVASTQPHSNSPAQLANAWGTPIWTPEHTLKFLDKVQANIAVGARAGESTKSSSTLTPKAAKATTHGQHTAAHILTVAAAAASPSPAAASTTVAYLPPPSATATRSARSRPPLSANVKRLRGNYIKIEAFDRHYRPYYREFEHWPSINVRATESGQCPFWQGGAAKTTKPAPPEHTLTAVAVPPTTPAVETAADDDMTRRRGRATHQPTPARIPSQPANASTASTAATAKAAISKPPPPLPIGKTATENRGGYCEICHNEYDALGSHLVSTEHRRFVTDDANFKTLDTMIGTANMDSFLRRHAEIAAERASVAAATAKPEPMFGKRSAGKKSSKAIGRHKTTGDISVTQTQKNSVVQIANEVVEMEVDDPILQTPSGVAKKHHRRSNNNHHVNGVAEPPPLTERSSKEAAKAAVAAVEGADDDDDDDDIRVVSQQRLNGVVVDGDDDDNDDTGRRRKRPAQKQAPPPSLKAKTKSSSQSASVRFASLPPATVRLADVRHRIINQMDDDVDDDDDEADAADHNANEANGGSGDDDDNDRPNRVRARRMSAKRINYSELRDDDDSPIKKQPEPTAACSTSRLEIAEPAPAASDSSTKISRKMHKMRLHGVRWRAPSDEDRRSALSQTFYKVVDTAADTTTTVHADAPSDTATLVASTSSSAATLKRTSSSKEASASTSQTKLLSQAAEKGSTAVDATSTTGLKLRVCRVRNSELSVLTNEADKFMFPRQNSSSEPPTDEDRQSTSDFGGQSGGAAGDLSADVATSSEADQQQQQQQPELRGRSRTESSSSAAATASTAAAANVAAAAAAALDSSNKRKRRKQLEAFLNDNSEYYKFDNPDSRLRFQEAPFQPILSHGGGSSGGTAAETTANEAPSVKKSTLSTLLATPPLAIGGASASRQTRSAVLPPPPTPSSPRTPTRSSRRMAAAATAPGRDSDVGKGAIGTPTKLNFRADDNHHNTTTTTTQSAFKTNVAPPANAFKLLTSSAAAAAVVDRLQPNLTEAMLSSSVVQAHRFAFERVPVAEPWYETFRRQDECREQIFEYWGSTVYRKLPYELGPLPPHAPDCCALARLTPAAKRASPTKRQTKKQSTKPYAAAAANSAHTTTHANNTRLSSSRRSTIRGQPAQPPPPPPPPPAPAPAPASSSNSNSSSTASLAADQHDIRVQKRLLKLHKNLEVNVLPNHHSTAAQPLANSRTAALLTAATSLELRLSRRSVPASQQQQQQQPLSRQQKRKCHSFGTTTTTTMEPASAAAEADAADGAAAAKGGKGGGKPLLLDVNGRPRKSPREHASTLAILSCLVQQRRKREKELNGGVSPDKRQRRRARRARSGTAEESPSADGASSSDSESDGDDGGMDTVAEEDEDDDEKTAIDDENDETDDVVLRPTTAGTTAADRGDDGEPMDIPADPPPTPPPDQRPPTPPPQPPANAAAAYPPMPQLDQRSSQQLCRELDELFAAGDRDPQLSGYLADMEDLTVNVGRITARETDAGSSSTGSGSSVGRIDANSSSSGYVDDLVLIGSTPADFVDIVESVDRGKLLRYRHQRGGAMRKPCVRKPLVAALASFGRATTSATTAASAAAAAATSTQTTGALAVGRKRRNNRTGWPTLQRRRPTAVAVATLSTASASVSTTQQTGEAAPAMECDAEDETKPAAGATTSSSSVDVAVEAEHDAENPQLFDNDDTTCSTAITAPLTEDDEGDEGGHEDDDDEREADEDNDDDEGGDADADEEEAVDEDDEIDEDEDCGADADNDNDKNAEDDDDDDEDDEVRTEFDEPQSDSNQMDEPDAVQSTDDVQETAGPSDLDNDDEDQVDVIPSAMDVDDDDAHFEPTQSTSSAPSRIRLNGGTAAAVAASAGSDKHSDHIFTVSSDSATADTSDLNGMRLHPAQLQQQQLRRRRSSCNTGGSEHAVAAITPTSMDEQSTAAADFDRSATDERHDSKTTTTTTNTNGIGIVSIRAQLLHLQPVVRMKKILLMPGECGPTRTASSKTGRRRSVVRSSEERLQQQQQQTSTGVTPSSSPARNDAELPAVVVVQQPTLVLHQLQQQQQPRASSSAAAAGPKTQFSPPKLRKPRGRWYRER